MTSSLHTVFVVYLLAALGWNLAACLPGPDRAGAPADPASGPGAGPRGGRGLDALVLLLQALATAVLLRDRLVLPDPAWLPHPLARHLLPVAFGLAVLRNLLVVRQRGWRPSDPVLLLHNLVLGVVIVLADLSLGGAELGPKATASLHAHSIVQLLLGTPLAQTWTLSWHVPLLVRRRPARSLAGLGAGLVPAALAAFLVLIPAAIWRTSAQVLASFEGEPGLGQAPRPDLAVGVARWDPSDPTPPPGALSVWVLPYDHDGLELPPRPARLVLELRPPDAWWHDPPAGPERRALLLGGAERLADALHPELLLPVAEPDGETSLAFPPETTDEDWLSLLQQCRERIQARSPETRLGLRLAGTGRHSEELFRLLAPLVDVIGPRLAPAGSRPGGARAAVDTLLAQQRWWAELPGEPAARPELWLLAVGCSPLAFGERAQARFVEGWLARADADVGIHGLIVDGWRDRAATRGLLRPDGSERLAARRLAELLAGP